MVTRGNHLGTLPSILRRFVRLHTIDRTATRMSIVSTTTLDRRRLTGVSTTVRGHLSHGIGLGYGVSGSMVTNIVVQTNSVIVSNDMHNHLRHLTSILRSWKS